VSLPNTQEVEDKQEMDFICVANNDQHAKCAAVHHSLPMLEMGDANVLLSWHFGEGLVTCIHLTKS
jgi:hypothetical protein